MQVKGQLRSKFYLAFTITDLSDNINDDLLFLYANKIQNNTEKISGNTYYFIVGINISDQCGPGQYYDNKKFIYIIILLLSIISLVLSACIVQHFLTKLSMTLIVFHAQPEVDAKMGSSII